MPIIESAIKQMRQNARRAQKNAISKKTLKEITKNFLLLVEEGKMSEAVKLYPELQKRIDLTVKKNLWHANKGARMKSRYAKLLSGDPTVKAEKKSPAKKKAAPKKTTDKKTTKTSDKKTEEQ